jgi:hypothetical protein
MGRMRSEIRRRSLGKRRRMGIRKLDIERG